MPARRDPGPGVGRALLGAASRTSKEPAPRKEQRQAQGTPDEPTDAEAPHEAASTSADEPPSPAVP